MHGRLRGCIASFNTMENAFEPALFPGVDKYHADPIVMVWSGKGEGRSMKRLTKGKPTLKTLLPFAKKHSPALKTHWDTVKAALDDDNKRIADEKAGAFDGVDAAKTIIGEVMPGCAGAHLVYLLPKASEGNLAIDFDAEPYVGGDDLIRGGKVLRPLGSCKSELVFKHEAGLEP